MSDPTHSSSFPGPVFLLDEAGIQWRDDSGQTQYADPDEGGLSAAAAGIAAAMRARVVVMGGQTWRERVDAHLAPVAARVEWVERSCLFAEGVDSGPVIYLGSEIWAYAAPTWHCVHQAAVLNQALFAATAGIERLATTQVPLTHNGFGQNTAGAVTAGAQLTGNSHGKEAEVERRDAGGGVANCEDNATAAVAETHASTRTGQHACPACAAAAGRQDQDALDGALRWRCRCRAGCRGWSGNRCRAARQGRDQHVGCVVCVSAPHRPGVECAGAAVSDVASHGQLACTSKDVPMRARAARVAQRHQQRARQPCGGGCCPAGPICHADREVCQSPWIHDAARLNDIGWRSFWRRCRRLCSLVITTAARCRRKGEEQG